MIKTLDKAITNSAIYRLVIYLIGVAKGSHFFYAYYRPHLHANPNLTETSLFGRLFGWLGKKFNYLVQPIKQARQASLSQYLGHRLLQHLQIFLSDSWFGRRLLAFRPVYLLMLYPVIDYSLRYYIAGGRFAGIWDEALMLLLLLLILSRRLFAGIRWKLTNLDLPILAFMLIFIGHMLIHSPELAVGIDGLRVVIEYLLWYFVIFQLIDTNHDGLSLLRIGLVVALLIGLHAIYQYLTKAPMLGNWVDSTDTTTTRAYSILLSPNLLGSFFVLFLPISFSLFLREKPIILKLLALSVFIINGLGLLVTFSRGAWLAAFIGLILYFFFTYRQLLAAMTVAATTAVISVPALSNRFFRLFTADYVAKSSAGGRLYRYQKGLEVLHLQPLLGVGLGRFGGAVAMNYNLSPFYMDNYYMKTLVETGYVGLISMLVFFGLTLYFLIRKIRSVNSRRDRLLLWGLLSGLCGVLVHNGFENIFESPLMVTFFWSIAAIIMAWRNYQPAVDDILDDDDILVS